MTLSASETSISKKLAFSAVLYNLIDRFATSLTISRANEHMKSCPCELSRHFAPDAFIRSSERRDLAVEADRAHVKNRNRHSATSAGFGASLTSIVNVALACTPPLTSVTSVSSPLPRNCAPTGTGAGKRTLSGRS